MTDSARTHVAQEMGAGASVCRAVRLAYFCAGAYIASEKAGLRTLKQSVIPMRRKHISACFLSPFVNTYRGSFILCSKFRSASSFFKYFSYGSVW